MPHIPASFSRPRGRRACSYTKRCTSARVNPSSAIVRACSGPSTTSSWLCEKYQPTLDPSDTAVSQTVVRMPEAVVETWSLTLCGGSPPYTVTVSPSASGPHGDAASFSAMQYENFAGLPCVAMSYRPGHAPPTFRRINRIARPIVALARKPGPKQPLPPCRPIWRPYAPFTTSNGATGCVVACTP